MSQEQTPVELLDDIILTLQNDTDKQFRKEITRWFGECLAGRIDFGPSQSCRLKLMYLTMVLIYRYLDSIKSYNYMKRISSWAESTIGDNDAKHKYELELLLLRMIFSKADDEFKRELENELRGQNDGIDIERLFSEFSAKPTYTKIVSRPHQVIALKRRKRRAKQKKRASKRRKQPTKRKKQSTKRRKQPTKRK